ncbi:Eco57I restriction-modification methylase domain-containing protein [Polaribacter sp.]|uniref:Eco57I restriction-modification methylase domain-containing protein n=1 Tax=Polaribacter sp. TaxID=1920175 RepID=UPI003F4ACB61
MTIKDLVKKYQSNRDRYLKADYNETQLRTDFLDPLFELLEWDIKNDSGKPTNEREVLVEEGLKEDASSNTKKPDYTFRLFSERKFFLEAKKPNVKIENDNEPAKQVRRYGFTGKLKISVLSNFEHLAIYDCSKKVEKDDIVTKSRIKIYHYTEYETAFEEIKKQLGNKAVYSGEFDETWKDIEEQLRLSSVDDLFLAHINEWRIILGKEIYSHKSDLKTEELNDIVQSYINSIIFLRVCEDRNLETYKTLLNFAENKDFSSLIKKFKEADKKYNAGLFGQPLTDKVISDSSSAFWIIIKDLYFPESTYSFSVFASDILGNIYEIFLGEQLIVENGEISLQKKPENIDRDIVTTPTFIIQDILRQTVLEYCKNKSDKEILNSSFADIACGSGAFLLEIYQLLQDILVDYYLANDKSKLIQTTVKTFKLPYSIKREVLENCVFGIDKDYNAVEACKFGLLLKLLENENKETITIPALPNIDKNIQFGNSLIDSSISTDEEINPFDFKKTKFDVIVGNPPYMATEHMKQLLPNEKTLYEKHYQTAYKQYDKYFLFIERGLNLLKENGYFGYIIPSKFTKVGSGKKLRELLSKEKVIKKIISFGANQVFKNKTTYTSILILSKSKNNSFLNTEIKKLSEWKIRDFDSIISEEVETAKLSSDLWFLIPPFLKKTYNHILKQSQNLEDVIGKEYVNNGIQTSANDVLVLKPHKEDANFIYFEKKKISYKIEKEITKPYYETDRKKNGIKLNTYRTLIPNAKVIFPYKIVKDKATFITINELKKNFPFAYQYLFTNKARLTKRDIQPVPKTDNEWYRLGRSQYLELGAIKEKIIIGVMSSGEKYPIDFSKTLHTAGGTAGYCSIYLSDKSQYSIYYIQAILNSRYVEWLIHLRGEVFKGGYIARGTKVLRKTPIRTIDFTDKTDKGIHDKIVTLQKELIKIQSKIDTNKGNARKLTPLNRKFINKKAEIDYTLKVLYNLGENDNLIPAISEMYATN